MRLKTFPGGVHPPDKKIKTSQKKIEVIPLPHVVICPMSQHIGAPCEPLVKVGDWKMDLGYGIAAGSLFLTGGAVVITVIKTKLNGNGSLLKNGKYVSEVTCKARFEGVKEMIRMVRDEVGSVDSKVNGVDGKVDRLETKVDQLLARQ